jgi:hypothetical protein
MKICAKFGVCFFLNKNKDNNFNDGQILENKILKTKLKANYFRKNNFSVCR